MEGVELLETLEVLGETVLWAGLRWRECVCALFPLGDLVESRLEGLVRPALLSDIDLEDKHKSKQRHASAQKGDATGPTGGAAFGWVFERSQVLAGLVGEAQQEQVCIKWMVVFVLIQVRDPLAKKQRVLVLLFCTDIST